MDDAIHIGKIIAIDVGIAYLVSSLINLMRSGTSIRPPPAPKTPLTIPVTLPTARLLITRFLFIIFPFRSKKMLKVKLICVGKLKEKEYKALVNEYEKRLSAFCNIEIDEITEERLPTDPSDGQIYDALELEAAQINKATPTGAHVVSLCVEGKQCSSVEFSKKINDVSLKTSKLCFIIGGSNGLSESVKSRANDKLSFSEMTFPHHLFRIMLLEQIYRAFTILKGKAYHK